MRNLWFALNLSLFLSLLLVSASYGQNCTSFFGQVGVPAGGTDYFLCTVPGSTLLDATNTQGNPSSYTWSTGDNTPTITVTGTGTYTVTVGSPQHPDACVINFSVQLTNPMQPGLGNDTAICFGDTLNLGSDFLYDTYSWSTGDTSDTLLASAPGTYMLTVADNNGCTASDTITITNNALPIFNLSDDTICTTDSLTITPSNINYDSYLWSTGETSASITTSAIGTYYLTVTDVNSCSTIDSMVLSNYPLASTNLGNNYSICPEDTTTLSPGAFYSSYLWSDNSTNNFIDVNLNGTYWIETVDTNNCVSSDTITISHFAVIAPNLGNNSSICEFGDTITLDAGAGYNSYNWSTSAITQTIETNNPGTYSVTTVDANSCESSDTIIVSQYPTMVVSSTSDTVCVGDTATILATAGYASYLWSTGETTNSIQTASTGVYDLTVTDTNSCEIELVSTVSNYPSVTPNIGLDDTLCYGLNKTVDAGTGYSSYQWSTGGNLQTENFDTTGTYWVEVTDNNGCTGRDSINLMFEFGPSFSLGNDTIICEFDTITLTTGTTGATYLWSTNESTSSISVSSPGQYTVSITGSNGCVSSDSISISNFNLPVVNLGNDIYYCQNTTFNQPLDAGSGFTVYNWMNGSNAQILVADQSMTIVWVEVIDNNTCSNSDTIQVIQNQSPYVNLGSDDSVCSGQGTVLNSNTSPSAITSYLWSTNETTPTIIYTAPLNVTTPVVNSYSITVTDTNSCVNSDTINVTALPLPTPDLGNDTAYCFGDNFSHTLNPGNYAAYDWNTGNFSQTITVGAFDSIYSVTVTDINGCQSSDFIFVTENQLPSPDLGNDTSYCEGVDLAIVLNPGGYQGYQWSTGGTNPYLLVTQAGTYNVTVTDANGCSNSDDKTINMLPKPLVDLGGDITMCDDSAFTVTVDASTQLPANGYSFLWNTGSTLSNIFITDFGTYSVTVTNQNTGCFDSSDVELIPFEAVEVSLGDDSYICENDVLVLRPNVSVSNGYSYLWSNGATTPSIQIDQPGEYWVELNANNGTCVGRRDTINYTRTFLPELDLGPDIESCIGQPVVLKNLIDFPDTLMYLWHDTIVADSIIVSSQGLYRVSAINVCGTVTDEVNVLLIDCFQVYIPTAFTPNEDGLNDSFKPITAQNVTDYFFQIYNRWGEVVFETNDKDAGWNGFYNGNEAPDDVYVWKLFYISAFDPSQQTIEEYGNVVLAR